MPSKDYHDMTCAKRGGSDGGGGRDSPRPPNQREYLADAYAKTHLPAVDITLKEENDGHRTFREKQIKFYVGNNLAFWTITVLAVVSGATLFLCWYLK